MSQNVMHDKSDIVTERICHWYISLPGLLVPIDEIVLVRTRTMETPDEQGNKTM